MAPCFATAPCFMLSHIVPCCTGDVQEVCQGSTVCSSCNGIWHCAALPSATCRLLCRAPDLTPLCLTAALAALPSPACRLPRRCVASMPYLASLCLDALPSPLWADESCPMAQDADARLSHSPVLLPTLLVSAELSVNVRYGISVTFVASFPQTVAPLRKFLQARYAVATILI